MDDPFGFAEAVAEETTPLDLSAFQPKPRPVDRQAAAAGREAARDSGFTTRRKAGPAAPTPPISAPSPDVAAASPPRARKRRVNIAELLGIEDKYPDTERAQLNLLAPVPVVLRWRRLVEANGPLPAWETLELAMDALEAARTSPVRMAGDRSS